jgi:hypothetical protein
MTNFLEIKEILDNAVGGAAVPVAGPHRAFWRTQTRDQFVNFKILGLPIVTLGNGSGSTIVKALRGEAPFGQDFGTPGASFRRMPAGLAPMAAEKIAVISAWIDAGCPDKADVVGAVEALLEGAPSGGFLIVSSAGPPIAGRLTLRTTDGSQGDVTLRVTPISGATLQLPTAPVHVSGTATQVDVVATAPSSRLGDTTIEVVQGPTVLASVSVTAISEPRVRFRGTFQCRLATDPDDFDDQWGHNSSFGMYAVQGPDPANPDEPPLDRIVRFHDAVALRPFCDPIGVTVTQVEAEVGGDVLQFTLGDGLIGEPVRLGPNCKFDGRNRTFAPDGFEPISDFRLEIGSLFAGASAPAVARPTPADPPGSTGPYANGIIQLDVDPSGGLPSDYGLAAATWAENGWSTIAFKLAQLIAQQPADERGRRIRDRRLQEHTDARPGHGLGAVATPFIFMERYTGLIDREITIPAGARGFLAYLAGLSTIRITADFLAFDTDCQIGRVTGTLDAPDAALGAAELAAPHRELRRVPLDEQ